MNKACSMLIVFVGYYHFPLGLSLPNLFAALFDDFKEAKPQMDIVV